MFQVKVTEHSMRREVRYMGLQHEIVLHILSVLLKVQGGRPSRFSPCFSFAKALVSSVSDVQEIEIPSYFQVLFLDFIEYRSTVLTLVKQNSTMTIANPSFKGFGCVSTTYLV
jgi:hypothetical protein